MAYNNHSSKRAAEDYARVNHSNHDDNAGDDSYSNDQPSKKPRFDLRNPSALAPDALEQDTTLDADVIGNRGQQVRRGAVNIDGYDSDSDNENFDVRAAAKEKDKEDALRKTKDEDENDMFADLQDDFKDGDDSEGDADRRGGRKKAVRFLDEDEIEGQVKNSKSGGHVSADFTLNGKKGKNIDEEVESSSDSEVDDATRADVGDVDEELGAGSKKMHAPKLDAFNMRTENDEGRFDEQGNYVRKAADADAIHDVWLEGISKKEMKKANEAHHKREEERRKKAIEDDAKSDADVLDSLLPLLRPSETILEALARLNKSKKQKANNSQSNSRKLSRKTTDELHANDEAKAQEDAKEAERTKAIDTITEAADLLLARGQNDVYDVEKELLMRQYQRTTGTPWRDSAEPAPTTQSDTWEYRWSDARDGGQAHGPYDGPTMKAWTDAGYFGEGVEFRQIGMDDWSRAAEFI